jgi:hypothetical protein
MRCFLGVLALAASAHAVALDVESFEKMQKMAASADSTATRSAANTSLSFYFAGISDALNGVRDKTTGELQYAAPGKICLPDGVRLSSQTLRAMTAVQVEQANASEAFKPGWKSTSLDLFVFLALASNYPCARK